MDAPGVERIAKGGHGSRRLPAAGLAAAAIAVFMLIAPLAALSGSATDNDPPHYGWLFTFNDGDDDNPTLFIGPDRVPLATWEDEDGRLYLSRLSLTGQQKAGIPLSNLPRTVPAPFDGHADVTAMDANGLLHVVWEDGSGGVWHKAYDDMGNVEVVNHRLSSTDAVATAPAIAATVSEDGAVAWITWIEERDRVGTHVRVASIDSIGVILSTTFVDGILSDMGPTACDVYLDTDGDPHVMFIATDGDYWAYPDGEGGYDLHLVHDADGGALPLMLQAPGGPRWAVFETDERVYSREMTGDGLGPRLNVSKVDGAEGMLGWDLRAMDLATVLNGGYLAVASLDPGTVRFYADANGTILPDYEVIWYGYPSMVDGESMTVATVATDDRGQSYIAKADRFPQADRDCVFNLLKRAPDVTLRRLASIDPLEPVLIRPGTSLDVTVVVDSVVGYDHPVQLDIASGLKPPVIAEVMGDEVVDVAAGGSAKVTVRITASLTASPGTGSTVTLEVWPEGWPEAVTTIDIPVLVPRYQPFIVRGPEEAVSALPGEPVTVTFTIESWSDSDEVVTLEPTAPKGWTVEAEETRSVPAGGSVQVDLEVTAPEGAPEGTLAEVGLGGRTSDGTTGAPGRASAVVTAHTGVTVDVGTSPLTVVEGSAGDPLYMATREARVRNTGNREVDLTFLAHPSREGWTATTTPSTMRLTPGSEATLVVAVGAPDGALWGTSAQVMLVAAVADGPSLDVRYLPCTVGRTMAYAVEFLPSSTPLMDGRAEVDVRLSNAGNGFEDLTVELLGVPVGWEAMLSGYTEPVRLAPGGTRMLSLTLVAPMGTPAGEVHVAARAWGSYGMETSKLKVVVPERFSVDVKVETEARELNPPGTVVFPLSMVSSGNAAGEARLSLEGLPPGWDYSFNTPEGVAVVSFPMGVGDARAAQLSLRVPSDADGDHAVDLVVRDRFGEALDRVTLYVRLRLPDLAVTDMLVLPAEPREGTPMTVRARVLNLGMADAEDVSVVLKEGGRVIDRDTLSLVPRMGELEVVLYMVPQQGRLTLVLEVDPADLIRERSESNNMVKRHLEVAGPEEEPLVAPEVAQASLAIVVTASILGLLGGTETGKYAFLTLVFIPLYTKIKKNRVLDHYLRGKIHGYIIANPGEHYNAIKDQLEVTNGALSYHLRVLEREGYIRSRMDGIFKRFYPADMKLPTTQRNISSFQEVILTIVKNNQGLSQKDIAKRIGASSQVINYHVKILEDSGLIRVDRTRRRSRVYATDAPTARAAVE